MKTIAIIPARSGSKGLKDKNIKLLNGKPLMSYTIEAAFGSGVFDTVMVSTDSEKYAKIAVEYGAEVPFLRSEKTSTDEASTRDCIIEVLSKYKERGRVFDRLAILQPTSPMRTSLNIIKANELYIEKKAKTVIGVCETEHSPLWCNTIDDSLSLENFIYKQNNVRRQALDKYYIINGAIYFHDVDFYINNSYCFDKHAYAYIMKKEESIDIDDEMDFLFAKTLFEYKKKK